MGRVHISRLLPGMMLEKDVYNESDQLILPEGLKLTDKSIAKLTYYGINSAHIVDMPDSPELFEEEHTSSGAVSGEDMSYSQRLKQTEEFKEFEKNYESTVDDLQSFLSDVVEKNMPPDTSNIMAKVTEMLHPASGGSVSVFDMIRNMKHFDDMTYVHCLNVGLICNVFAKWLGLTPAQAELATQCGILHDIGKLKIPEEIIKKPSKLTDDEFALIKSHPAEGYKILKNCDLNLHIKLAALQHHEKVDGSGYPMKITGDKMDMYAKLVCIADIYEAMTAVRIYRGSLSPFQVIEAFETEGLQKYDTRMIMTFLENIVNTYLLNRVRLSDGREGEIIFINKQRLSKPTIKCGDEFVDLTKEPNISIVSIL